MGTLRLEYTRKTIGESSNYCIRQTEFETFNPSILELGDISAEGEYFEALAAIFDLEAFTSFCNQIDPHLVIPEYLSEFLDWLFDEVKREFMKRKYRKDAVLWCPLPFYAKFLGDGVMFIWDTRGIEHEDLGNIVVSLLNICVEYRESFLPKIRKSVSKPPSKLRCGIARGQIISIGDGQDFVGPCINVAARLQKIGQFSFAFSKKGFNFEKCFTEVGQGFFTLVRSSIRGIGEDELYYVSKVDFEQLSDEEQIELLP